MNHWIINDITTTPDSPPEFFSIKNPSYPQKFKQIQKKYYKDISPLKISADPQQVFKIIQNTATQIPRWKIVGCDPMERKIEVVCTSYFFRFKDDIIIQVQSLQNSSIVHMRSKSRIGKGDLGINAKRIRQFLQLISKNFSNPIK